MELIKDMLGKARQNAISRHYRQAIEGFKVFRRVRYRRILSVFTTGMQVRTSRWC